MIDKLPKKPPRSTVVEQALIFYFKTLSGIQRDRLDLEILNSKSEELNEEALDVLEYQIKI